MTAVPSNDPASTNASRRLAPVDVTHASTTIHDQSQSLLFQLPPELRCQIYEEVLSVGKPRVLLKWHPATCQAGCPFSVLALVETCRRIYAEASTIFYYVNSLYYDRAETRVGSGLFRSLSPGRRDHITNITILVSSGDDAYEEIKDIAVLSELQSLRIERKQTIRWTNIQHWIYFAKEMKVELQKLDKLQNLEIYTPETLAMTAVEEQRLQRLNSIDDMLREAIH